MRTGSEERVFRCPRLNSSPNQKDSYEDEYTTVNAGKRRNVGLTVDVDVDATRLLGMHSPWHVWFLWRGPE